MVKIFGTVGDRGGRSAGACQRRYRAGDFGSPFMAKGVFGGRVPSAARPHGAAGMAEGSAPAETQAEALQE
ncbi:hypothetical protein [Paenirhodobacter hankyongi]|uniref:hypothetical protein n=1 Tax=Paenirhodobacter hankyongi TaxID=2294033 RepID=UPI0011C45D15|nr:hypothetical protein [Sinirhodobacter hankyongi]